MKRAAFVIAVLCFILMPASKLFAQESEGDDQESLSRDAANPLANLMSFPFQNNTNFNLGPYDRAMNILNIQPVIPFADGKIITRTIIPVVWIPDITAESGYVSKGLGDMLFTAWYTPPSEEVTWGIGAALELPTGGENRGSQKWSLGPSFVALTQPGNWTLGLLANHVWSVGGESERDDVSKGLINLFVVYQLGDGWYVNSAPIITSDWKAEKGQRWIVPIGAGFGKLAYIGKLPVNMQVGAYYNVVKPDIGPDWQLRVQLQFLLPMSIFSKK